jgi:hypothetical protein
MAGLFNWSEIKKVMLAENDVMVWILEGTKDDNWKELFIPFFF